MGGGCFGRAGVEDLHKEIGKARCRKAAKTSNWDVDTCQARQRSIFLSARGEEKQWPRGKFQVGIFPYRQKNTFPMPVPPWAGAAEAGATIEIENRPELESAVRQVPQAPNPSWVPVVHWRGVGLGK